MNLDLVSALDFGDVPGLRGFWLDHHTVHVQTAQALNTKFKVPVTTFGLLDQLAEDTWVELMQGPPRNASPPETLRIWLELHAQIHNASYALLSGTGTVAPDLSIVDFSVPQQFYDWMSVHQSMHDFEQQSLGLL